MADPNESGTEPVVSSVSAPPSGERVAWLVEAVGPHYLAVSKVSRMFYWERSHDAALQLATKEQAEGLRDAVRIQVPALFPDCYPLPEARAHAWMAPRMKHETQSNTLPAWPPSCDRCKAKLEQAGAIVLSPPATVKQAPELVTSLCMKFHLCAACYRHFVDRLVQRTGEQK